MYLSQGSRTILKYIHTIYNGQKPEYLLKIKFYTLLMTFTSPLVRELFSCYKENDFVFNKVKKINVPPHSTSMVEFNSFTY